jgi:hypothetical protein
MARTASVRAILVTLALAVSCRESTPPAPGFIGRATLWTHAGASVPANLRMIVQDTLALDITSSDGSFSFPSDLALLPEVKVRFEAAGAAPAHLRPSPSDPIRAVLLPNQIAIPSCSVHGGLLVPLDLLGAFRPSSPTNTSYFDRANTLFTVGRIVVASWQTSSIRVALSDTGAASKQFTAEDSAEVRATLDEMTSYFCQAFHFASVAEANPNGVVLHKDPDFAALGSHSMALPNGRGDYTRASVVVRRISPVDPASRDTIRRTIMHELLHVLGMGHTCSWASLMTTGTLCEESLRALKPSPEDVAHYFAMLWAREGERNLQTTYSLTNAYLADVIARGLAEPAVRSYYTSP